MCSHHIEARGIPLWIALPLCRPRVPQSRRGAGLAHFRGSSPQLSLHRRALLVLNLAYFGVLILAGAYAALNPPVQRALLGTVASAFSPSDALGPLVRSYMGQRLNNSEGEPCGRFRRAALLDDSTPAIQDMWAGLFDFSGG